MLSPGILREHLHGPAVGEEQSVAWAFCRACQSLLQPQASVV